MISRLITCKPQNSSYRRLADYIADAKNKGEKTLDSWHEGCWAVDHYDLAIQEVLDTQDLNTRSKKEKTYHLIVSFRPEDEAVLKPEDFREIEKEFATVLGFEEHQRHCGVHKNTNNLHMHIAYNMIHPEKLTRHEPYRDYHKRDVLHRVLENKYGLQRDNGLQGDGPKRANEKAVTYEAHSGQQSFDSYVKERENNISEALSKAQNWQDLHIALAKSGLEIRKRGNGCIIKDSHSKTAIKASSLGRNYSKGKLEKQLGPFEEVGPSIQAVTEQERYEAVPIHRGPERAVLYAEYKKGIDERKLRYEALKVEEKELDNLGITLGISPIKARTIKERILQDRRDIRAEIPFSNWNDFLKLKVQDGNKTALAVLQTRQPKATEEQSVISVAFATPERLIEQIDDVDVLEKAHTVAVAAALNEIKSGDLLRNQYREGGRLHEEKPTEILSAVTVEWGGEDKPSLESVCQIAGIGFENNGFKRLHSSNLLQTVYKKTLRQTLESEGYSTKFSKKGARGVNRKEPVSGDNMNSLELERHLRAAFQETTERRGNFLIEHLKKDIVEYFDKINYPLEMEDIQLFLHSKAISKKMVALPGQSDGAKTKYTIKTLLQAETDNRAWLKLGSNRFEDHVDPEIGQKMTSVAKNIFDFKFEGEQLEAALGVLSSPDFITCIQGDPGTGKTTLLQAVIETHGRDRVLGLSKAGSAAKKLGDETGITAQTIDRFCIDYERRIMALESGDDKELEATAYVKSLFEQKPALIIVDEASMMGSMDAVRLCNIAAKEGARIVAVGDTKQLPGVGAGKPFEEWQKDGAKTFRLKQIRRQKGTLQRQAVEAASHDDAKSAVQLLVSGNIIKEVEGTEERIEAVVQDFFQHFEAEEGMPLLITSLNSDREAFNKEIRASLVDKGIVAKENFRQEIELPSGETAERDFAAGDSIIFLKKGGAHIQCNEDDPILNGTRGKILSVENSTYLVETESGQQVNFTGDDFNHFDHAYCISTYKSQGLSSDSHVIYHAPAYSLLLSKNEFLVGISRNKNNVSVYTDNFGEFLAKVQSAAVKKSALDLFEKGNERASSSLWLRTAAEAIEKRLKGADTLREERSFLIEQAGKWSDVSEEDRNRINEAYTKMKEDFHQRMSIADEVRTDNTSELEKTAIQKYKSLVQGVKDIEKSKSSFADKMSSQNKLVNSFMKEFMADFAPQGKVASWKPEKKTSFTPGAIINADEVALNKEYKEVVAQRKAALENLKEERAISYQQVKGAWQGKRREWIHDRSLLRKDKHQLLSLAKMKQLQAEEGMRKEFDSKRGKIWSESGFRTWNDYLYMKAQNGDACAMEVWAKQYNPTLSDEYTPLVKDDLFKGLETNVDNRGNILHSLENGSMIKDNGDKIFFSQNDATARKAASKLAQRKFGDFMEMSGNSITKVTDKMKRMKITIAKGKGQAVSR
ncbi:TraI/MobA(P) family conjugative relaxase [Maridesulfovibrio frigidus]|uniref:TraI/MobA(P) family conjugative relaxase n=1 Tax=Maridesulfovibrio frigidus TaxID=340956 RepID=UPI0009FDF722|nr:TraI/MobA(P) family conjugative relaxase [Maridesulfovibrio frigidus]